MKIKNKKYIILLIFIVIIIAIIYFNKNNSEVSQKSFVVETKDLIQKVNVVSQVKPKKSIEVAFQASGRIDKINFNVGEKIQQGDIIMELNNDQLISSLNQKRASLEGAQATLNKYRASLESAQIKLIELQKGSKPEEVRVYESKLDQAKSSLKTAESNLTQVKNKAEVDINNLYNDIGSILNNAYLKSDDAINYQVDDLFKNDNSESPEITFITGNSQAKIDIELKRPVITDTIQILKDNINNIDNIGEEKSLEVTKEKLVIIRNFLNRLRDALNSSIGLSNTTLTEYKSNINTARTNINTVISNVETQQQLISSQKIVNENNIEAVESKVEEAKDNLELAENNLKLIESGATEEEIDIQKSNITQAKLNIQSQEATIKQIQAEIQSILTSIQETKIKSPIDGILAKKKIDIGEVVSQNQIVALINSEGQYEIKANIPEMDIAKVKIGDKAEVNLDAYNDEIFIAEVVDIAPAETIIDNLTTYETTLFFVKENNKIKSGMTADVDIITNQRKNALVIPSRLVIKENNENFVKKIIVNKEGEKDIKKIKVETGIKGSLGEVEILKGLNEGDKLTIDY